MTEAKVITKERLRPTKCSHEFQWQSTVSESGREGDGGSKGRSEQGRERKRTKREGKERVGGSRDGGKEQERLIGYGKEEFEGYSKKEVESGRKNTKKG